MNIPETSSRLEWSASNSIYDITRDVVFEVLINKAIRSRHKNIESASRSAFKEKKRELIVGWGQCYEGPFVFRTTFFSENMQLEGWCNN